ncbi:MAG: hypothetical protein H7Y12_07470 [Sphingobacteriaceae bacterium]|nr:hypothetical protein [Cytophagaceae bacterium]
MKITLALWLVWASFSTFAQSSAGLWPYPTHPVPTDARGLPLDSTAGYFPSGPFLDSARYTLNTVEVDSGGVILQRELSWPQLHASELRWREARIRYRIVSAKPAFRITRTQTPTATTPHLFYKLGLPVLSNAYTGRETYRAFVQQAFSSGYLVVTAQRDRKRYYVETQVFKHIHPKKNGYSRNEITYQQTERQRSRLSRADFEKLRAVWQERKLTRLSPHSWRDSEVVMSDDGAQWLLETHLPDGYHFIGCSHSDLRNAAGAVKAAGREMLLVGAAVNIRL